MLSTGNPLRHTGRVKVSAPSSGNGKVARQIEQVLKTVPGTSIGLAEAHRRLLASTNKSLPTARLARYGLMEVTSGTVATALGGQALHHHLKAANALHGEVRYPLDLRSDPRIDRQRHAHRAADWGYVPLGEVASVHIGLGPRSDPIRT